MEKILKLNKVNKRFGGVVTALDVCMELEPGAIHGLIGPNGAGKTTLLNLISGIYEVDSGSITFMGRDITHMPSHERAHLGLGAPSRPRVSSNAPTLRRIFWSRPIWGNGSPSGNLLFQERAWIFLTTSSI